MKVNESQFKNRYFQRHYNMKIRYPHLPLVIRKKGVGFSITQWSFATSLITKIAWLAHLLAWMTRTLMDEAGIHLLPPPELEFGRGQERIRMPDATWKGPMPGQYLVLTRCEKWMTLAIFQRPISHFSE
jgi:hypothetical protein